VRVAVGVLARVAYAFGDCAFPVAALSAAADAMSVAYEVAADEPRVAPGASHKNLKKSALTNVRFGSLADIIDVNRHVR